MQIKRLEIVGFKSFVDKVSFDFGRGITAIVGPNGCGKSNVVDALRWVMGEQNVRQLRGKASEDVIFGGSETRQPLGYAQVSVVFDNRAGLCPPAYKDYAEIMVTRCLYRSGESIYLINKTPCRLLDITELFMDTGVGARAYSIIEQGKVGMLVSAKPEERRTLVEEVAGVTKYKARKKTALRKLEATGQNLLRLGDIITEVRRSIGSLKRQARQAEKYREHRAEVKRIELCLSGNRFRGLHGEIEILGQQEKEQAEILARLDNRLQEGDLELEEKQLNLSRAEAEHSQVQERRYQVAAEIQRLEGELEMIKRQRQDLTAQQDELLGELDGIGEQQERLEQETAKLNQLQEAEQERLACLKGDVTAGEDALGELRRTEQSVRQEFEQSRNGLFELTSRSGRLQQRRDEIDRRLSAEDERRSHLQHQDEATAQAAEQLDERKNSLAEQLQQLRQYRSELSAAVETTTAQQTEKQQQLQQQEESFSALQQQLERVRSRRESLLELQRNREGYADGPRTLLAAAGARVVVADIVRVPESYETAVEMALGERLQAVVLSSEDSITDLFKHLNNDNARGLLLSSSDTSGPDFADGVPLLDKVTVKAAYQERIGQLLAGVYLVADVTRYQDSSLPAGLLLVDQQGRCLDWRGVLSGGATAPQESGLLRRQRQLEESVAEIERLERACQAGQADYEQAATAVNSLQERLRELQTERHQQELKLVELDKDYQGVISEEESLRSRQALIDHNLQQLNDDQAALRKEQQELDQELSQSTTRRQELEEMTNRLQSRLDQARADLDQGRDRLTTKQIELAAVEEQHNSRQEARRRIQQQQKDLDQRQERLRQRREQGQKTLQELAQQDQQQRVKLDELFTRHDATKEAVEQSRNIYEGQSHEIEAQRDKLRQVRAEAEELRRTVARLQLRQRELQVDADHLQQTALDRYHVDLADHQVPEATESERERQQEQLKRLQQRIADLGEVNLMAIDEFRQQEERYDFLCQQRDDLNRSMEDLRKAVNQINRTTRHRFKETFEEVNRQFQEVFPRLFRGGQATLRLTDEENLLETGIDIVVQPPGKRLQNVNLLSGGEKALTAVALIFSLFLIKPTPFCVLDEVDAPLDDANIDRFAAMVRNMTDRSQFVLITHSKRTMSIVDRMYGVTMQEPGVSKLVSVKLHGHDQPSAEQNVAAG